MKTKIVRPVLIESKELPKIGDLCFSPRYKNKLLIFGSFENSYQDECRKQQLILISLEDEKIEDYNTQFVLLCEWSGRILTMSRTGTVSSTLFINHPYNDGEEIELYRSDCKKVIATQFQISPEYIQQFIEEYNKEEVKDLRIEMEVDGWDYKNDIPQGDYYNKFKPKLTNGFVTIVNKEVPTYTEKEAKIHITKH